MGGPNKSAVWTDGNSPNAITPSKLCLAPSGKVPHKRCAVVAATGQTASGHKKLTIWAEYDTG